MPRRVALLAAIALACGTTRQVVELAIGGDEKTLRHRPPHARQSSPGSSQILLIAFDGISRDLLYDLLRQGKLPNLAALLGGDDLSHAYLDETFLSGLPSTTMAAWVSVQTGAGAAHTGVTGNEYFVRERRDFVCPAPVSFSDAKPTLRIYTHGYLNDQVEVPSVYERIHDHDPDALVWVGMNHFYRGADKLLLARRTVLVKALEVFFEDKIEKLSRETSRAIYKDLDDAAIDAIVSRLAPRAPVPDVLTLYISGTDLWAHVAKEGPDEARRSYLTEVVDPALRRFVAKLRERRALDNRWVIVTGDHGHTEIRKDKVHSISTGDDGPVGLLQKAGFRLRPLRHVVADSDPFSAVLAYGGAMAYVYLADRSRCPGARDRCDWTAPPRYREDVLAAADAFYTNNIDGHLAPALRGTLDMILVRQPKSSAEVDDPFEVYVGGGATLAVGEYLRAYPHPTYVALEERLEELAAGPYGERAGDILLIAHNGDRDVADDRYYFAGPDHSWHGSPSALDSEIPLIVAHRAHATAAIGAWVKPILGDRPFQRKITDIMLGLRTAPPGVTTASRTRSLPAGR